KIKYALSSYDDLVFPVPMGWKVGNPSPPKFLIFFDSITDAINATKYLCKYLPVDMQEKIKWFNADMTKEYANTEGQGLED
ncbi:hypothetical protein P692DRAFT_20716124, partial [Suillus brevipes Sb2]